MQIRVSKSLDRYYIYRLPEEEDEVQGLVQEEVAAEAKRSHRAAKAAAKRRSRQAIKQHKKERSKKHLTRDDVGNMYNATSYLGQKLGLTFNAMATISYGPLGLSSPSQMLKVLTDFLDEARGQMKRWGYPFHYAYVHENGNERGLHTHILMTINRAVRGLMKKWIDKFFRRHCPNMQPTAVDIQIKAPRSWKSAAGWQADRLQYLIKGIDPDLTARSVTDGVVRPLIDLIGLKERYRNRSAGIIPFPQRVGGSRSIWIGAQEKARDEGMPMLSPFNDRAWPALHLNSPSLGWELEEHIVRQKERQWRDTQIMAAALGYEAPRPFGNIDVLKEAAKRVRAQRADELKCRHPYTWERHWLDRWWDILPGLETWGGLDAKRGLAALRAGTEQDF